MDAFTLKIDETSAPGRHATQFLRPVATPARVSFPLWSI
jgi:hypothetical protein